MADVSFRPCAVVPVYNHATVLRDIVADLAKLNLPVFLVDDGSSASCRERIEAICEELPDTHLVRRGMNGGKGAAVKDGLRAAFRGGFSHALQIDADGQHDRRDVPLFLSEAAKFPEAMVYGYPVYDASVPRSRLYGRYITTIWVWINTLSLDLRDTMCGFRVYSLAESCALLDNAHLGDRMDFDTEFIVHWHWRAQLLRAIATRVTYPENGISHFRLWRDNSLISWMHARLFLGMIVRLPVLLRRKFERLFQGTVW